MINCLLERKQKQIIEVEKIYSTENQCKWLKDNYTIVASKPGAQEYYNSLFEMYAAWGVDFVKIDDLSAPIYHKEEIELIRNAIDNSGREIVLSTSPGETPVASANHVSEHANMWRMVNDVWDKWDDLTHLMKVSKDWYPYIGNGTWPDCDMIPLGRISIRGERGSDRMTRLTKDEQYSLMTFFTIFKSPLFFGGDLQSNDDFTLSLLTNAEVLKVHQQGTDVKQIRNTSKEVIISATNKENTHKYLAVFNIDDNEPQTIEIDLDSIGINKLKTVKNLWSGVTSKVEERIYKVTLQPHQSQLLSFYTN